MATWAAYETHLGTAKTHFANGDYRSAMSEVRQARFELAALAQRVNSDGTLIDFSTNRQDLDAIEKMIKASDHGGVIFQQAEF